MGALPPLSRRCVDRHAGPAQRRVLAGMQRLSIWDFLESSYRWEQEFGDAFDLHSFDAHGRPAEMQAPTR